MDAKITKKRIAHLLSYDWIKMVVAVVVAVVIWSLVFTMTATGITTTQRFVVCNYLDVYYGDKASTYPMISSNRENYSHEIIEAEIVDNMRGGGDMFGQLFQGNLAVGEGDVMMVPDSPMGRTPKKDESGNELVDEEGNVLEYDYEQTYLENAVSGYSYAFTRLDDAEGRKGYFTQMREYLARFYTQTGEVEVKTYGEVSLTKASFEKGSLNKRLVEEDFRARVKRNKDKRYKKESQIVEALQLEYQRLDKYLDAYDTFFTYLDLGAVAPTYVKVEMSSYTVEGAYGINLCPNEATMGGLKEQFYYSNLDGTITAKNMTAVFLCLEGLEVNYQYENLLFLNELIKNVYVA